MKTCIVILSMHRSGSSALTRTLSFLGPTLPKTLVASSKNDNDLGFWESQSQVDLNDEFLESIGSHWYDFAPPSLDHVSAELKQGFIERAVQLIDEEFGDAPLFVMKDPRISLLFPLWYRALQQARVRTLCVLPIRNPLEIANSLYSRNRIPRGEGQVSWLRFVLNAERHSRNCARVFVSYDSLLSDWRNVTTRISEELGLTWPNTSEAASERIDSFLSSKWRHHNFADSAVLKDPEMSPWIKDTLQIMISWCEGIVDKNDQKRLDSISAAFDASLPAYRKLVKEARNLSVLAREIERKNLKLQEEMLEHRNAKAVALSKITQTETLLAKAVGQAEAKVKNLVQAEAQLTKAEIKADTAIKALAQTEAHLAEAVDHAQCVARQVSKEYQKRNAALKAENTALVQETQTLRATASELRKILQDALEECSARIETYVAMIHATRPQATSKPNEAKRSVVRRSLSIPRRGLHIIKRLMQA